MLARSAALVLVLGCAQLSPQPGLGGTSWQLAAFRGGDGTLLRPDDASKYTLSFSADGVLSARIDCNRARASWTSPAPGRLEFGPIAATRAQCPPGSMHDQLMRQLPNVRSYVIREKKLYLSLMADGGTYEFVSLVQLQEVVSFGPYAPDRERYGAVHKKIPARSGRNLGMPGAGHA